MEVFYIFRLKFQNMHCVCYTSSIPRFIVFDVLRCSKKAIRFGHFLWFCDRLVTAHETKVTRPHLILGDNLTSHFQIHSNPAQYSLLYVIVFWKKCCDNHGYSAAVLMDLSKDFIFYLQNVTRLVSAKMLLSL